MAIKQNDEHLFLTGAIVLIILVAIFYAIGWESNREYQIYKNKYQSLCQEKGFVFIAYDIPGTGHYADCVSDDGYSWYYDRYNNMLQRRLN
jgi:hypothetical protein